jgi:hypothetical protein
MKAFAVISSMISIFVLFPIGITIYGSYIITAEAAMEFFALFGVYGMAAGLFISCLLAIIYSAGLGPVHLFRTVKHGLSGPHPEPMSWGTNYIRVQTSTDTNSDYMHYVVADQNFRAKHTKMNKHPICIDDHIKYFFSNAEFAQRKALPLPDKKETTKEASFKEKNHVFLQREVEHSVTIDGSNPNGLNKPEV